MFAYLRKLSIFYKVFTSLLSFSWCTFVFECILISQNHDLLNQCVINSYVVK